MKTALYPHSGKQSDAQFVQGLGWADEHQATAFFASVGVVCAEYPDKTPITDESEAGQPIRNAGFHIKYEGLLVMTTSDRVEVWGQED